MGHRRPGRGDWCGRRGCGPAHRGLPPRGRLRHHCGDGKTRLRLRVCQWSQAEMASVGRTYFDSLEDAMRAFGTYVGTHHARPRRVPVRRAGRDLDPEQPVLHRARPGRTGAWPGPARRGVSDAGRRTDRAPLATPSTTGAAARKVERHGALCPNCFEQRSLSRAPAATATDQSTTRPQAAERGRS